MNRLSTHEDGGTAIWIALVAAWIITCNFSANQVAAQSCDDAGSCAVGCCDGDVCCDCGCQVCCPWEHCTGAWGEFLYLHPTGVDMAHAQQQNGTGGAGTTPFGLIGVADPDYEPGFGVGVNWALTRSSSIAASYTFFESHTTDVLPIGAGSAVGSLVQHPGAGIISSAGPLTADYDIDFQLADLVYRRLLFGDNQAWMNYSLGVRYGHLEQEFLQSGTFSGSQFGTINVLTDLEFDGAGVLLGLEGERRFGNRGFSFYGSLGVSPLVGQFSTAYTMQNVSTTTLLANVLLKDDRFVTLFDYELGFAWTSCDRCWRISSGYVASFWYNAITTPGFVDAVQADNYVDLGDTISFDGFTTRLEYRF